MAIIGSHALLYSTEPEAVREIFRDVFGFDHLDSGDGWLIFAMPPCDLGVHPVMGEQAAGRPAPHDFSLQCDDIESTMAELGDEGIEFTGPPEDHGYGLVTHMDLPGGLVVQLYQPFHPRPTDGRPA